MKYSCSSPCAFPLLNAHRRLVRRKGAESASSPNNVSNNVKRTTGETLFMGQRLDLGRFGQTLNLRH
jgi:hypothetical protein